MISGFPRTAGWASALVPALVLAAALQGCRSDEDAGRVGTEAPDFALSDVTGRTMSLHELGGGKHVLLNFWGTWCVACKSELPELTKLDEKYKDKLSVVGVSVQEEADGVGLFAKKFGLPYPVLLDRDAKVMEEYGVLSVPFTIVVGPDGKVKVRARQVNVDAFRKQLADILQ